MKRFLVKVLIWILVLLPFFIGIEAYLNRHKGQMKYFIGKEVLTALSKSKQSSGKKTLVLGDSVCKQLYPSDKDYDGLVSLACNRAISLAGHYFLFKNYLDANQDRLPERVILILAPLSAQNQLDRFAYHYMLKNFLTKEYKSDFDEALWQQVRKIPVYWSASWPFIRVSNYAPDYNPAPDDSYDLFSPISQSYLLRIARLAEKNQIAFTLICAPVDFNQKEAVQQLFKASRARHEIPDEYLDDYIRNARFCRDSISGDSLHFKRECIPTDYYHLLEP